MEELKSTSRLSEWVDATNEIIRKSNKNQGLLDSLSLASFVRFEREITSAEINASIVIDIETSGVYTLWNNGSADAYMYVEDVAAMSHFSVRIEANDNYSLMLNAGNKIYLVGLNYPKDESCTLELDKTLLEVCNEYARQQKELIELIATLEEKVDNYETYVS